MSSRGHLHNVPNGKPEVKEKLWHEITTKTENITYFKDYGRLQIQFCTSLHNFSNNWRNKHLRNLRKFHLRCFINKAPGN